MNSNSIAVPLILVSGRTDTLENYRRKVEYGAIPRSDYIEIAEKLGGVFSGRNLSGAGWYGSALRLQKRLKIDILESTFAVLHASEYNAFLSTSEKMAVPLSLLLAAGGKPQPHILIAHHISSKKKAQFFRLWKIHQRISQLICICRSQASYAVDRLNFPASKVTFIYDKVDHRFFHPLNEEVENYILAVGQEQRDYKTLAHAVSQTGIRLVIVASSPWSTYSVDFKKPENMTVLSHISYPELRRLYARARLVVTPLFETDYAAGANSTLEAMAMGKAVICSGTAGMSDYIVPVETGLYSAPENSEELRYSILNLWNNPAELRRLGDNARQAVETSMNMDIYISRVVEIIHNSIPR